MDAVGFLSCERSCKCVARLCVCVSRRMQYRKCRRVGSRIYKLCMRNIAWDCHASFIRATWLRQFTFMQLLHRAARCPQRGILFCAPRYPILSANIRAMSVGTANFHVDVHAHFPSRTHARALRQRSFLSHAGNLTGPECARNASKRVRPHVARNTFQEITLVRSRREKEREIEKDIWKFNSFPADYARFNLLFHWVRWRDLIHLCIFTVC